MIQTIDDVNILEDIIGDYTQFLAIILDELVSEKFDLDDFVQLDALDYRAIDGKDYIRKKMELGKIGSLLSEISMDERVATVFRLKEPVYFLKWRIDTIKLLAPYLDEDALEGLVHVRFVLFDELGLFLKKYSNKQFDAHAVTQTLDPMITYKIDDDIAVEFHTLSLSAVAYLEARLRMTELKY